MRRPRITATAVAAAGLAATIGAAIGCVAVAVPASAAGPNPRQQAYTAAADRYGVPVNLLLAVSYLSSRWDVNAGEPSTSGGYGPMHLIDPALADAGATAFASAAGQQAQSPADLRGDEDRPAKTATEAPTVGASAGQQASPAGQQASPAGQQASPAGQQASPAGDAASQQSLPDGARTLPVAAALTGMSLERLKTDAAANIAGGAAVLARFQRDLGRPAGAGSDAGAWFAAVARYSGAREAAAARAYADEVYAVLAGGAERTTDDGYPLRLPATRVRPDRSGMDRLGLTGGVGVSATVECPTGMACAWLPAPYQLLGDGRDQGNYGNHDLAARPTQQKIEYIVIHDTEGSFGSAVNAVRNPNYVSWHYTIRSSDGYVAQHVPTKDVAWQAGNWYVNAKSVGIEHEGYAASGTWFTEALYRSSARLVKYLATRFGVKLDRAHVIGHDNVPGIGPTYVAGMHWDTGPYWDWARYFSLLGAPLTASGSTSTSNLVTIKPNIATYRPQFYGCTGTASTPCPVRGSADVTLRTGPGFTYPLVNDIALRPDGSPSTLRISDIGARAGTGQRFAVAGRSGSWVAIWYLGKKAWLHNPSTAPNAIPATGQVAIPKAGRTWIPVYGRAYPEAGAYPPGVDVQPIVPLQYRIPAGQRYVVAGTVQSEYYHAVTYNGSAPRDRTVIRGALRYVQVQVGHRLMYVNAADVDLKSM